MVMRTTWGSVTLVKVAGDTLGNVACIAALQVPTQRGLSRSACAGIASSARPAMSGSRHRNTKRRRDDDMDMMPPAPRCDCVGIVRQRDEPALGLAGAFWHGLARARRPCGQATAGQPHADAVD